MGANPWTLSLLTIICFCRIGMGIYNGLYGPTLLYLSKNVGVSVGEVSTVFTARSVGILLGAIIGGVIKHFVGPDFRHLITLGSGVGIMGLMDLCIPWISQFWILIINITISGIMFGYLDSGLQALLLQLWGEKASRPHIQLFHLMYSVGAFVAPLYANPFLAMANELQEESEQCPNAQDIWTTASTTINTTGETTDSPPLNFNPIGWSYIIAASWLIFVALGMIMLSLKDVERNVSDSVEKSGLSSENRTEEPIQDVIGLFAIVIVYYFFCVTAANVFYNFIYSISICSDLQFTVRQASAINSVFWLGYGGGRFFGIFITPVLKPRTIMLFCLAGAVIDMVIMCIWGETVPWVAWTVSGLHGFTTSMLYPCGVSWTSQITNMSGTYLFIFNIGNALGSLTMLPLAGYIFDIDPFSVNYLILALAAANAIAFVVALFVERSHKNFLKRKLYRFGMNDYSHTNIIGDDETVSKL